MKRIMLTVINDVSEGQYMQLVHAYIILANSWALPVH